MPTSQQIFEEEFESIKKDLANKHRELGMKASGQWEGSLEVESGVDFGRVIGEPYTEQLVNGRKPGKFPPIQAIEKWIVDKGIIANIEGNITVSSLAFLIARKIAKEGTEYFKEGGTDLVESVFTPQRVQKIIDKLGAELAIEFSQKIERELKQIAV